ncbi:MAG: DUF885 domain-containing protein [Candidatus Zixiibacteriota bacterium]
MQVLKRHFMRAGAGLMAMAVIGQGSLMAKASDLDQLFSEHWEYQMRESPTWATYLGDHRYDDRLPDLSSAAVARQADTLRMFLARVQAIAAPGFSRPEDSLNADLFEREMNQALEDLSYRGHLMPVTQQSGPQIDLPELVNVQPFETVKECEDYIARLNAIPAYLQACIGNMREGISVGLVPARITMEKALPQIDAHLVSDPAASLLAGGIEKMGEGIPKADRDRLRDAMLAAIRDSVTPAFRKFAEFVRNEYLPSCRDSVGLLALPDGKQRYRYLARRYTTTYMDPELIYQIGTRELARIHDEMRLVMEEVGIEGSLRDFADGLRREPAFFYTTPDSLVQGFKDILATMDQKLPLLFGRLPKVPYGFREMESYRAESAPDAYYYPAPEDRSRPGYFYINTYRPEMRPKYTMEALAYHEAVPGHHLQIGIQQELENLPQFRQHGGYTSFVEGWALYSEQLPKEVGLYADPFSEFGRLTFDAWRAARLVVDVGIHYYGWDRDKAIDFFRENTALSDLNIVSEIDRYIAWPGQALAYKIGQLKILELRQKAEDQLGDRFDIRAFHDELLSDGALPLDLLEKKMDRWLNDQAADR